MLFDRGRAVQLLQRPVEVVRACLRELSCGPGSQHVCFSGLACSSQLDQYATFILWVKRSSDEAKGNDPGCFRRAISSERLALSVRPVLAFFSELVSTAFSLIFDFHGRLGNCHCRYVQLLALVRLALVGDVGGQFRSPSGFGSAGQRPPTPPIWT